MPTIKQQWFAKIDTAIRENMDYVERGRKIIKKYREDCDSYTDGTKYNLLYSNTETLLPVLYNRTPQPECRAMKKLDTVSRTAARILEETLANMTTAYDFDYVIKSCVKDYLLPGTGVARVVYEPTIEEKKIDGKKQELKIFDEVYSEYIHWDNILFISSRS